LEEYEQWISYLSDEMAFTVGMPSMEPCFPARPRPIYIGDVKLNNINVSNSVVGTINHKLIHNQTINGRDLLKNDENNRGDLKKIPAESQLTIRYHREKTDILVAGCYRSFRNENNYLHLSAP